jgi:hypothetical protein
MRWVVRPSAVRFGAQVRVVLHAAPGGEILRDRGRGGEQGELPARPEKRKRGTEEGEETAPEREVAAVHRDDRHRLGHYFSS